MTIEEYQLLTGPMVTVRMDNSGDVVLIDREWVISLGPGRVEVTVPGHEGTGMVIQDTAAN